MLHLLKGMSMSEDEAEILGILTTFGKACLSHDVDSVMSLFHKDVIFLGSQQGQTRIGSEEVRLFFEQTFEKDLTYSWEWTWHSFSFSDEIAWLAAEGVVVLKKKGLGETRNPYSLSAVFEKKDSRWLWRLYHGARPSIPIDTSD
jgi:uncharacterized protein (TIGR02246 family)